MYIHTSLLCLLAILAATAANGISDLLGMDQLLIHRNIGHGKSRFMSGSCSSATPNYARKALRLKQY